MAVIKQDAVALADLADDIAHLVPIYVVKTQSFHFGRNSLAAGAYLAVHTRNGADLAEKADEVLAPVFHRVAQLPQFDVVNHLNSRSLNSRSNSSFRNAGTLA